MIAGVCGSLSLHCPAQCLACSRSSVNVCWTQVNWTLIPYFINVSYCPPDLIYSLFLWNFLAFMEFCPLCFPDLYVGPIASFSGFIICFLWLNWATSRGRPHGWVVEFSCSCFGSPGFRRFRSWAWTWHCSSSHAEAVSHMPQLEGPTTKNTQLRTRGLWEKKEK